MWWRWQEGRLRWGRCKKKKVAIVLHGVPDKEGVGQGAGAEAKTVSRGIRR